MKRILNWVLAATIIFSATTFTGCKKDSASSGQWGAETLSFKVNNSSDEFILKKVEGGDYSMEYMYENQVRTVKGTLSDFYFCPVEVTNKLWADVMGFRPEGQSNNGDAYPVSNVNYYDYAGPVSGEKMAGCGGCYSSEPYTCTSSYHGREKEHNGRDATLGFRIVLRVSKP